jgi:hypothetical protein
LGLLLHAAPQTPNQALHLTVAQSGRRR